MKAFRAVTFLLLIGSTSAWSQTDSISISLSALRYADSLETAFVNGDWGTYIHLSYPGVVKYYGGRKGFENYVQRNRELNSTPGPVQKERIAIYQMIKVDGEWQCVLRKTRTATIDHRKAVVVSYLVGQSTDGGLTWKYVDVALNATDIIYIMPDIFESLTIPQREIIFEKTEIARN